MEPARGEGCISGQQRGSVVPGKDRLSCPDHKNPPITLQLQQSVDQKGDPPRQYRLAGCGNSNPTVRLLIERCSTSQRAGRVAPQANTEVPPHPGRIISPPRIRSSSLSLQRQQPVHENGYPPVRYRPARFGNPNLTGWLLACWQSWSWRAARLPLMPRSRWRR